MGLRARPVNRRAISDQEEREIVLQRIAATCAAAPLSNDAAVQASLPGGKIMSALLILCAMLLVRTGQTGPAISGFGFGAGRVVGIILAVLVGGTLVALIRAGGSRK